MNRRSKEYIEENSQPITETGCWVWEHSCGNHGYPQARIDGTMKTMHRVAYEAYKGRLGDKQALHTCDNKLCVNPNHLYAGTNEDNRRDAVERGQHLKGEDFVCTDKTIYTFKHKDGTILKCTVNELYTKYNLNSANVWRMIKGKRPTAYGWRIDG